MLYARRVVFPLAPVDLEYQQRHVTDGGRPRPRGCPRPRQVRVVCVFVFGEGASVTARRLARLS